MEIQSVSKTEHSETLNMTAVSRAKYDEEGSDENNTYARFTPSATLAITIANPALRGKFEPGQQFYVDFTPADEAEPAS
jgi:hypothetical protein